MNFNLQVRNFTPSIKLARSLDLTIFTLHSEILTWFYWQCNQDIKMSFEPKAHLHMPHPMIFTCCMISESVLLFWDAPQITQVFIFESSCHQKASMFWQRHILLTICHSTFMPYILFVQIKYFSIFLQPDTLASS